MSLLSRLPPPCIAPRLHLQPWASYDRRQDRQYFRHPHSCFHTTPLLAAENSTVDPYEILGLTPTATQAEIKKQYYHLSKTHHPDRNPNDQEAAARKFSVISDAYHILGDHNKRERYDRDQQRQRATANSGYSETEHSYAGGRKPSGLSRRRTHFRGPPPSFYRSGGWGESSAKRTAHAGADSRESDAQRAQQQATSGPYAGATGNWPFRTDPNDVGHFDRDGHYRTTSSVEEQLKKGRQKRRQNFQQREEDTIDDDTPMNIMGRFAMVIGMLAVGVGAPLFFFTGGRPHGL